MSQLLTTPGRHEPLARVHGSLARPSIASAGSVCRSCGSELRERSLPDHSADRRRASFVVRSIWAACLLVAGANHARILLEHGLFWTHGGVGQLSAIYWSSLTILDPAVAALLFARPNTGVISTIILITTNVVHNLMTLARLAPPGEFMSTAGDPFVVCQIGFVLFVLISAHIAWRPGGDSVRKASRSPSTAGA